MIRAWVWFWLLGFLSGWPGLLCTAAHIHSATQNDVQIFLLLCCWELKASYPMAEILAVSPVMGLCTVCYCISFHRFALNLWFYLVVLI